MSAKVVDLAALARDLASRSVGAEANAEARIQTIRLFGGLNLGEENIETAELEAQAGVGQRIARLAAPGVPLRPSNRALETS